MTLVPNTHSQHTAECSGKIALSILCFSSAFQPLPFLHSILSAQASYTPSSTLASTFPFVIFAKRLILGTTHFFYPCGYSRHTDAPVAPVCSCPAVVPQPDPAASPCSTARDARIFEGFYGCENSNIYVMVTEPPLFPAPGVGDRDRGLAVAQYQKPPPALQPHQKIRILRTLFSPFTFCRQIFRHIRLICNKIL